MDPPYGPLKRLSMRQIRAGELEESGAEVVGGAVAGEPVIVGTEPEKIVGHGEAFHDANGVEGAVAELIFGFGVIELAEDLVGVGVDLQNDAVLAAENIKMALMPGKVRIMGAEEAGLVRIDLKMIGDFHCPKIDGDDQCGAAFVGHEELSIAHSDSFKGGVAI